MDGCRLTAIVFGSEFGGLDAAGIQTCNWRRCTAVQEIFAPIVRDTAISFELEVPDVAEMRHRILNTVEALPWLVCEHDGRFLGYVYAGPYRSLAAYQWGAEVTVYIDSSARRMGVGRGLYQSLFNLMELQGYRNVFAGITLPNDASVGIHESIGFQLVGVYRDVGHKFDRWQDVGWWQLLLGQREGTPGPPTKLPSVAGSQAWIATIDSGLSLLHL